MAPTNFRPYLRDASAIMEDDGQDLEDLDAVYNLAIDLALENDEDVDELPEFSEVFGD